MELMRERRANAVVAAVREFRFSIVLSLCRIVWERFVWNDLERFDVRKACINVLSNGAVGKYCVRVRESVQDEERRGFFIPSSGREKSINIRIFFLQTINCVEHSKGFHSFVFLILKSQPATAESL